MTLWLKRIGWGAIAMLLLLFAAFASLARITVLPADVPRPFVAAPTVVSDPLLGQTQNRIDPAMLIIPVAGVPSRQLTDTWGASRGNGMREHHAIDIMAAKGTPVLAAASGTVEKIFESVNGGHTIYVRTDSGYIHYYAHLDSYGVVQGQKVRQGQQIATVGNTGSAAGGAPHLHFEIKTMQPGEGWWKGTNVNPYPLLAFGPQR